MHRLPVIMFTLELAYNKHFVQLKHKKGVAKKTLRREWIQDEKIISSKESLAIAADARDLRSFFLTGI